MMESWEDKFEALRASRTLTHNGVSHERADKEIAHKLTNSRRRKRRGRSPQSKRARDAFGLLLESRVICRYEVVEVILLNPFARDGALHSLRRRQNQRGKDSAAD